MDETEEAVAGTASREGHVRGLPLGLVLVGAVMLAWTWRAWVDPLVDFGRELYVPWRLAEGARLYTDIAWFNGPLSQHWNALVFRLFGPGLIVLAWSNVLVLVGTVAALWLLLTGIADRLAAFTALTLFLLVFAFGQYVGIANYNWITPYSHELTHGVALALAALAALEWWRRERRATALVLGGVALGLCFLTKPEAFLAGAAGVSVLLVPEVRARGGRPPGVVAVAAILPVFVSTMLIGVSGTLGAWPSIAGGDVSSLDFYRQGMGLDAPVERAAELLAWLSMWVLALLPMLGSAWLGRESRTAVLPVAVGAGVVAFLALFRESIPWQDVLRPLPLAVVLVMVGGWAMGAPGAAPWRRWRPEEPAEGGTSAGRPDPRLSVAAFGLFALVLLGKMLLNTRVQHYGFVLAAPAFLLTVVALVGWLPAALSARGWRGDVVRAGILALLTVFAVEHLQVTRAWLSGKTEVVGAGRDAFRADLRGAFVNLALERIETYGAASLAVLPEGVMINYLARVPNPTPFVNFMPPEEILFGDAVWAASFATHPPDLILLVPKDTSEYGRGAFGAGYGRALVSWVTRGYEVREILRVGQIRFEIAVLAPRPDGSSPEPPT